MKKNQTGFTLIEVICSVALLAIIVTASASFFKNVAVSQSDSEDRLYANNIAQEVMEEVIRTGDLTKDYTANFGKGEFTVEVTSKPNASTIGGNGKDLNGDGIVDQTDRDLAATMYPDRPTTTKIPITYEATNVPDVGSTGDPGETGRPEQSGDPSECNFRIHLFDFIDEDLPMLIDAGKIVQDKLNTSNKLTFDEVYELLDGNSRFSKYQGSSLTSGGEASYITKAATCFSNLNRNQIYNILNSFEATKNNQELSFYQSLGIYSYSATDRRNSGAAFFHNAIHNGDCPNPASCEYKDRVYQMYDYLCDGTRGNLFHMIQEWESSYSMIKQKYPSGTTVSNTGLTADEKMLFGNLPVDAINRIANNGLIHAFNKLNMAEENSGTRTGPYLLSKLFDKEWNMLAYDFAHPTKLVDDASTIRFQLWPRLFNAYTFGQWQYSWENDASNNRTNKYGIQLIDLPYYNGRDWQGNPSYYLQPNIVNIITFNVVGGLSYRDMTLTADYNGGGYANKYYDVEADATYDYYPAIYYFPNIDYGEQHYHYREYTSGGYKGAINAPPPTMPPGNHIPEITPKPGDSNAGNGGTVDTDHGVQREKVTLWLELNVDLTDLYTVRVKNRKGKVISELLCDGNQAIFKAV